MDDKINVLDLHAQVARLEKHLQVEVYRWLEEINDPWISPA